MDSQPDQPVSTGESSAAEDARYVGAALALARRNLGLTAPNPCVGALVVSDGVVVGRGVTQPGGRPHAERVALAQAGARARGATIYITLEPCARRSRTGDGPACTDAILAAGIARVVFAAADPSPFAAGEGEKRLRARGLTVQAGVLAGEARRLNRGHVLRVTGHRPAVLLKMAATQDGFAATADRRPLSITAEQARSHTHMLRAQADAIMIGIGTALADDPQLTCRLPGLRDRSPIRVVLDRELRLPMLSQLVKTARDIPTWIVAGVDASVEREWALRSEGVEVLRVDAAPAGRLDLRAALGLLADWGVTRLMVEGGPSLADAMLAAGLVDEIHWLQGGWALGSESGLPAAGQHLAAALADRATWPLIDERQLGPDRLTVLERPI